MRQGSIPLYVVCVLTDFSAFVVVFAVSRGLAEHGAEPWLLGVAGAGLSLSASVGSVLGGWLSHRFDGRVVFVGGAIANLVSIVACGTLTESSNWYLPGYWLLGIGIGFVYPPLIAWLNRGQDAHSNHRGVSRTLILFCVSWNAGMMCGQLTAGTLFEFGPRYLYGVAFAVAAWNLLLTILISRHVTGYTASACPAAAPELRSVALANAFKRLSWIANLGGMFGGSMVIHLLSDLAVGINVPPESHGVLLACWRGVIIATYLVMHVSAFWHYRISTAVVSQLFAAAGLVIVACAHEGVTLLFGLGLLGQLVGYNYFSGLYYSTAGSTQERRALAAGIHEATLAAGMAVGTVVGGALGSMAGSRVPYVFAAVVLLALVSIQSLAWWRWVGAPGKLAATSE